MRTHSPLRILPFTLVACTENAVSFAFHPRTGEAAIWFSGMFGGVLLDRSVKLKGIKVQPVSLMSGDQQIMRDWNERAPPGSLSELKSMIASRELVFPNQLERVIRQALLTPELIAFGSCNSVALACSVSPTTVVRLAGFLGFESFRDFRDLFREHLRSRAARVSSGTATALNPRKNLT